MKLHLPSSLRKALLACLAAFAFPVSLPVTVGTGAAAVGSAVVFSVLSSQSLEAATRYTDGLLYSGDIYTYDNNSTGGLQSVSGRQWFEDGEGETLSAGDFFGKFWSQEPISNTLRLAGATSDVTQVADWNGDVYFGGLIAEASDYTYKIWRDADTTQQITFQAEDGGTVYASLQSSVYFNAKFVHLKSDADWRIAAGKTFTIEQRSDANYGDKAFTIEAGKTLTIRAYDGEEGGTFILQGMEMQFGAGVGAGAKLVVNQGASAELGSNVSAGNTGVTDAIEVNEGSLDIAGSIRGNFISVEVNDGTLFVGGNTGNRSQIGSLSVNGGSATLESLQNCYGNFSATEGGKIVVNDTTDWVTITGNLIADDGSISFVGEVRARNGNITIANGGKIAVGIPEESESFALYVSSSLSSSGGTLSVDEGDIVVAEGGSLSSSSVDIGSGSVNVLGSTFAANSVSIGTGAINVSEGGVYAVIKNEPEGISYGGIKTTGTLTSISVVGAGSLVKLSEGSALRLEGEVNVSEGGVLEIGDNSVITVDVSAGGRFVLGETTSLQGTPDIIVELPQDVDAGWEYQLFSGKVPTGLNVSLGAASDMPRGLEVGYDEKTGFISITGAATHAGELVWTGGDYTWKKGSEQWLTDEEDDRFYLNDNVTFTGDKESVITVVNTVKPGKLTISGAAYTFVGGSIEVQSEDGIEITEGAGVAFETAAISANKITVGKDAEAGFLSGTVKSGTLEISEGATVTIATEEEKSFAEGVTLEQGATLRIENKADWEGAVAGDGTLELSIGGLEMGISSDPDSRENVLGDEGSLASMLPGGDHHIGTVRLVDNSLLQVTASAQHGQFGSIGNLVVTEGSVLAILSTRGQNNKEEHGFGTAKNTLTIEGDGGAWEDEQGTVYEGAVLFGVALNSSDTSHYLNSNVVLSGDASVYVDAAGSRTGVLSDFEDGGSYTSAGHTLTINGGGTLMLGKYFHTEAGDVAGAFNVKAGSLRLNYTDDAALSGYHIHLSPGTQLELGGGERTSAYTIGSLSGNGQVVFYTDGQEPAGPTRELRFHNDYDACGADNEYTGSLAEGVVVHMQQGYQAIHSTVSGASVEMIVSGGTLDLNGVARSDDDESDYNDDPDTMPSIAYGANIANNTVLNVTVGAEPEAEADENEPSLASAENATLLMQNIKIGMGATVSLDLKNGGYADLNRAHAEENARLEIRSASASADLSEITTESGVSFSLELTEGSYADMSRVELGTGNTLDAAVQASELHLSGLAVDSDSTLSLSAAEGGLVQLSGASFAEQTQVSVVSVGSTVDLGSMEFAAATELNVQATDGSVNLSGTVFEAGYTVSDGTGADDAEVVTIPGAKVMLTLAGGSHDLSNISAGEGVTLDVDLQGDALARFTNTFPASGLHLMVHGTNTVVQDMKMGVGTRIEAEDGLLTLAGKNNIVLDSSMADNEALRIFSASVRRLALVDDARLSVDISGVLSDIMGEGGQAAKFYIAENDLNAWKDQLSFGAELALLNLKVSLGIDGSLSFQALGVDNDTVYWSSRDNVKGNHASNNTLWNAGDDVYASTDGKVAVYVDCDTFLNLRGGNPGYREDGLVLNNLMGANGSTLYMTGDGTGLSKVTIANNLSRSGLNVLEDVLGVNIEDVLTFDGNIDAKGVDIQLKHRDGDSGSASENSTTLLKGKLTMSNGELQMTSGKLELAGAGSDLNGGISFAGNDAQLVVDADTRIGGHIYLSGSGELDTTRQEHVLLNNADATITLNDGVLVGTGVMIGNAFDELFADDDELVDGEEEGSLDGEQIEEAPVEEPQQPVELFAGTLSAEQGSQQMENGSRLANVLLNLEAGSTVTVIGGVEEAPVVDEIAPAAEVWEEEETPRVPADWAIAGLTGEGALASVTDHQIDICVAGKDRSFSGDLSGYHGTMTVLASSHTQYFNGVTGGSGWNLTNTEGGRVEINLMGGSAPNHLTMGNLTLQAGSYTTILFDIPSTLGSNALLTLQGLTIEDGADVTLGQYKGTISLRGSDGVYSRVLGTINVAEDNIFIGEDVNWHLKGIRNASDARLTVDANGNLLLEAEVSNKNGFADFADNENSTTGANLLWDVQNTYQIGGDLADLDSLLYDLIITVDDVTAENNRAEANRVMAAVAGSSTAVMGEAVSTDMERQLRSIRNRTTSLAYSGDSYSRIHSGAWVNAESNYHKQEADGMLPGYKVNGWGGTVGAHTQVGESATVGIALTAMYSDLESDGPDHLKGDMDTYYLTGFVQVAHEAWRHTFVLSIGRADLDVDRTVAYADGGYTTKGSTDGMGFGALYELGYTIPLNVDYSVCLQPVFNVAWRLNELGAYTETGSNAALHIEEQTYNAVTFGVGARLQAAVGSNVWNRTGIFESRALLKVDVGDRQGKSTVALQEAGSFRGNVKSAEKGAVGVELGAGLALPTGRRGEVFVDGSAELRADYTNLNATIGYRINF